MARCFTYRSRVRSFVNVGGDCFGVAIVQSLSHPKKAVKDKTDEECETDDPELFQLNSDAEHTIL